MPEFCLATSKGLAEMMKSQTDLQSKNFVPRISEIYRNLIQRPTREQFIGMYDDIFTKGQKVSVKVSKRTGFIIDGYTRDEIIKKINSDKRNKKRILKWEFLDLKSEEAEIEYIKSVNVQRRHLSLYGQFESFYKIYESITQETRKRMGKKNLIKRTTSYELFAKQMGMSKHAVKRCVFIHKNATQETKNRLINDSLFALTTACVITQNQIREKNQTVKVEQHQIGIKTEIKSKEIAVPKVCPECNYEPLNKLGPTIFCHVHKKVCCPNCPWGI